MNSLFSFARHKSSIINSPVPIILLLLLCCIAGCRGGHPAEKEEADDLQQIKDSGELVVLTLYRLHFLLHLPWPGHGIPVW